MRRGSRPHSGRVHEKQRDRPVLAQICQTFGETQVHVENAAWEMANQGLETPCSSRVLVADDQLLGRKREEEVGWKSEEAGPSCSAGGPMYKGRHLEGVP